MNDDMSDVNFYAGGGFDRASPRRKDAAWVARLIEAAESRFVATWRGRNLVLAESGAAPRAAYLARDEIGGI